MNDILKLCGLRRGYFSPIRLAMCAWQAIGKMKKISKTCIEGRTWAISRDQKITRTWDCSLQTWARNT